MSVFPYWEQYVVPQRRFETGCIPAGYEFLLKAVHAQGIDFTNFQDEFDLDKDRKPHEPARNNFQSVANAIQAKYPHVVFHVIRFDSGRGAEKLRFIEEHIAKERPLLVSIAQTPFGGSGWHIMPVVDMDKESLILLRIMRMDGTKELQMLSKSQLVSIHDAYPGGDDVAYLEGC